MMRIMVFDVRLLMMPIVDIMVVAIVILVYIVVQLVASSMLAKAVSLVRMRVCHMSGTILTVMLVSRVAMRLLVAEMLVVMPPVNNLRIVAAPSNMI